MTTLTFRCLNAGIDSNGNRVCQLNPMPSGDLWVGEPNGYLELVVTNPKAGSPVEEGMLYDVTIKPVDTPVEVPPPVSGDVEDGIVINGVLVGLDPPDDTESPVDLVVAPMHPEAIEVFDQEKNAA